VVVKCLTLLHGLGAHAPIVVGRVRLKLRRRILRVDLLCVAQTVRRGFLLGEKCPCDRGSEENLGTVDDFIRTSIMKAAKERTIDEILNGIKVKFKVEVKRWNPLTKEYGPWTLHFDSEEKVLNDLLTKAGRDLIHNASFMTGAQPAALTYYAICNPATFSPADTDTTLNGEITTPSGLARHQCTGSVDGVTESFTHAVGTNTTVVVCGFKNNSGSAVTGIKGYGNFNAASGGTLGTESAFTSLDLNPNDILKLTVTLTLG